jgi:lia operon protein LiaG
MKKGIIIIGTLFSMLSTGVLHATEYKIPVENAKNGILSLSDFSGELVIEGYGGNEIVLSSDDVDAEVPERAKGLKPIYPVGTDNTGIGLSVETIDNQIKVTCLIPFTKQTNFTVKVPENLRIKVQSECQNSSEISISKMKNEIEIKTCHGINLKDVSGPLVLSTISGNIEITFGTISTGKPFSINSVSGDIDITLPATIAADLDMQTVSGTMYSDFDFSDSDKNMKKVGGNQVSHTLNGGGTGFKIVTVSGNIYLRKG